MTQSHFTMWSYAQACTYFSSRFLRQFNLFITKVTQQSAFLLSWLGTFHFCEYLFKFLKGKKLLLSALPAYLSLSQALLISNIPFFSSIRSLTSTQFSDAQMHGLSKRGALFPYLRHTYSLEIWSLSCLRQIKIQIWTFQVDLTSLIAWAGPLNVELLYQKHLRSLSNFSENENAYSWIQALKQSWCPLLSAFCKSGLWLHASRRIFKVPKSRHDGRFQSNLSNLLHTFILNICLHISLSLPG